jgi:hypothetical protein
MTQRFSWVAQRNEISPTLRSTLAREVNLK